MLGEIDEGMGGWKIGNMMGMGMGMGTGTGTGTRTTVVHGGRRGGGT